MRIASSRMLSLLLACAGLSLPVLPALSQDVGQEDGESQPVYSLSGDAAAGFILAADGLDPAVADSAAIVSLAADFLHRIEAPGWGLVLNHSLELSAQSATAAQASPTMTVYEAYIRFDLVPDGSAQLFLGKRRMGLGLGTVFAPGDLLNPRTGFWDQKTGFRGLALQASLGSDLSLRAALGLDRNLDATAAGLRASAGVGTPAEAELAAAYAAALDGAKGPADPRLLTSAISLDAQLGTLQLAASGLWRPDALGRASLGLGLDLGGVILQAEGAAEFLDGDASPERPDLFGTVGARYAWMADSGSLSLSLDYAYNGAAGDQLGKTHYLLPQVLLSWTDVLDLTARALVELEGPGALVSGLLSLHPARNLDVELSILASLGEPGGDAMALASRIPMGASLTTAAGLAARVHF